MAEPRESQQPVIVASVFSRFALFADPLHKGNRANSGGRSPLTITPMSRPSEAARTAGCAVAKRKPQTGGIFFFHEDTRTTRSARLPYYIPRVRRGRGGGGAHRKRVVAEGGERRIEIQSDGRLPTYIMRLQLRKATRPEYIGANNLQVICGRDIFVIICKRHALSTAFDNILMIRLRCLR